MFNAQQQVFLQAGIAAVVVFFLVQIGGVGFGAGLIWGVLIAVVVLFFRRQVIRVDTGHDILRDAPTARDTVTRGAAANERTAPPTQPANTVREAGPRKPPALSAPRNGRADDLEQITGVGPKLREMLNDHGYFHFDQIAGWTLAEVAWIDETIPGIGGRAARDDWVGQARRLAAEGN